MSLVLMIMLLLFGLGLIMFAVSMAGGILSNSLKWSDFWSQVCIICMAVMTIMMFCLCAYGVIWLGKEIIECLSIQ